MAMERLFQLMKDKGASDLFLSVNSPVQVKINGSLIPVNQQKLDPANIRAMLAEILSAERLQTLQQERELNVGIPVAGVGNFRLSAFIQRGHPAAVLRYVPADIPPLQQLNMPPVLAEMIMETRGLLLVVGATGSGKSTTIASMLDHRNASKAGHILTLEDPIEFMFQNRKSVINQREIGIDADSVQLALRNALRQAPDCILIGEIRDQDTMAAAIAYAQSGHLVVATLHANNSYQALNRIINFFPPHARASLLPDLAATLKAIISQRLVRTIDGLRRPAVEVLLNTRHVADLIEQGQLGEIREAIEKSLSAGSQTFEQALLQMIHAGQITAEEAMENADSATNLYWLLNNQPTPARLQDPALPVQTATSEAAAVFTEFTLDV